jgi:threonine 3-dehydrogenase
VVPEENCWTWDIDISEEVAAIQDPLGNAVHAALSTSLTGKTVLVTGVGPIGLCTIGIAKRAGASAVYATDVSDYRLELARQMGADLAVNAAREDPVRVVREATGGIGVDVLLEMSGSATAIRQGFEILRKAGFAALLGLPSAPVEIDLANAIIFKGAVVQGINGRKMFETWFEARSLLKAGLDITPVITHRLSLEDFEEGIRLMMAGECGKVILYP